MSTSIEQDVKLTESSDVIQIAGTNTDETNRSDKLKTKSRDVISTQSTDIHQAKSTETNKTGKSKTVEINESKNTDIYQARSLETNENESTSSADTAKIGSIETNQTKVSDIPQTTSLDDSERTQTQTKSIDRKRIRELKKVCILGAGHWGSVIAKIIGRNIFNVEAFSNEVLLYVQEEDVGGKNLSEIINVSHENVQYLPGHKLPDNVIAIPDVVEAAKEANILIFTIPHEDITQVCTSLEGKIKPTASALSLAKGFELTDDGNVELFSQIITRHLKIQTSVLMGWNLYDEIVQDKYCEATLASKDKLISASLKDLLQTENCRVSVVDDVDAVEVCGSLRNVIACGVGFVDGLDMGRSAKATVIRLGILEMIKFVDIFYPGSKISTFFESCGVSDLATSFLAGRNRDISEKYASTKRSLEEFEKELLDGRKLEGPRTAEKLHFMLRERDIDNKFPLFTAIYKVYAKELNPLNFLDSIYGNPEHFNVRLQHLTW